MNWKPTLALTAAAVAVLTGATLLWSDAADEPTATGANAVTGVAGSAQPGAAQQLPGHTHGAPTPSAPTGTARTATAAPAPVVSALSPAAQTSLQQLQRLGQLPAGDAAIALAQQMEAEITPENTAGYVQALLQTTHPAVERAAIAALARAGDSSTMQALAAAYGSLPADQRGRVLQVFENASNPDAVQGLSALFAADTSEKRSAMVVSALVGVAHIGSMESVQFLLSQMTPANADYALHALNRVHSQQGVEMIRAAASGSKDAAGIDARYLPALRRLAESRGNS